jgi:hypothetical protein
MTVDSEAHRTLVNQNKSYTLSQERWFSQIMVEMCCSKTTMVLLSLQELRLLYDYDVH